MQRGIVRSLAARLSGSAVLRILLLLTTCVDVIVIRFEKKDIFGIAGRRLLKLLSYALFSLAAAILVAALLIAPRLMAANREVPQVSLLTRSRAKHSTISSSEHEDPSLEESVFAEKGLQALMASSDFAHSSQAEKRAQIRVFLEENHGRRFSAMTSGDQLALVQQIIDDSPGMLSQKEFKEPESKPCRTSADFTCCFAKRGCLPLPCSCADTQRFLLRPTQRSAPESRT